MTRSSARAPGSTPRNCRPCGRAGANGNCTSRTPGSLPIASSPAAARRASRRADVMDDATATPVRLTGPAALRWGFRFARDPRMGTRRCFETFGPLVMLAEALPFIRPGRVAIFDVPLILTAGAAFYRELLSDPETWRGVSLLPGGPKNSAARRMSLGLTRMTGYRHAHYRKLLLSPLHRTSVKALIEDMAKLAETEVASWPVGETIDLWEYSRRLMRGFAVELLFGGKGEQGYSIAG